MKIRIKFLKAGLQYYVLPLICINIIKDIDIRYIFGHPLVLTIYMKLFATNHFTLCHMFYQIFIVHEKKYNSYSFYSKQ